MSRQVEHREGKNVRTCTCGAHFKRHRDLLSHIEKKAGVERVVWIDTPLPKHPHRIRKAGS